MKIFLAGASGVIGRSLVPRLAGAGHDVTGMTGDAATTGLVRSLGARPVVVDVFDRDRLAEVIRAAHPDAIIDQLTSLRHGDYPATNRLRTEGARNLIDAALSAGGPDSGGAKLLHLRRRHRGGCSPQKTAGYRQRAAWRSKFQGTKGLRMGTHPSQLA